MRGLTAAAAWTSRWGMALLVYRFAGMSMSPHSVTPHRRQREYSESRRKGKDQQQVIAIRETELF